MTFSKTAFVSDFDGTITDDDFFSYVAKTYFSEAALAPWRAYLSGYMTHFDALYEMYANIHVDERDLKALIHTMKIDPKLHDTLALCREKNIPVFICSAGNDYYIRELLGREISDFNLTLVTNKGEYSKERGLIMTRPREDDPYYDKDVGISKRKLVRRLKDEGYSVIFAGDGPPDLEPAEIADVVFAKKILLEKCKANGVPTLPFRGFTDIHSFLTGERV